MINVSTLTEHSVPGAHYTATAGPTTVKTSAANAIDVPPVASLLTLRMYVICIHTTVCGEILNLDVKDLTGSFLFRIVQWTNSEVYREPTSPEDFIGLVAGGIDRFLGVTSEEVEICHDLWNGFQASLGASQCAQWKRVTPQIQT